MTELGDQCSAPQGGQERTGELDILGVWRPDCKIAWIFCLNDKKESEHYEIYFCGELDIGSRETSAD